MQSENYKVNLGNTEPSGKSTDADDNWLFSNQRSGLVKVAIEEQHMVDCVNRLKADEKIKHAYRQGDFLVYKLTSKGWAAIRARSRAVNP